MTDDQFRLVEPLIPPAKPCGRPRTTNIRNLLDGLFYLVRTGCSGGTCRPLRLSRPGAPCTGTCALFSGMGCGESMRHQFVVMLRAGAGGGQPYRGDHRYPEREDDGERRSARCDAAKRLKGRKRQVAVDTDGLLLGVLVHAADIQDADSLGDLLKRIKPLYNWLRAVFADSIYNRLAALLACFPFGLTLIIVRRAAGSTGFVVQPRRWVVERSLGWLGRWRRLSKDYETLQEVSEAMVILAMIRLMLHRLAHPNRRRLPAP